MSEDRSQYYTGFIAQNYDRLVPDDEIGSFAYFRRALEAHPGAALELGCGTGRPLLDFLAAGLDVEGLDASADMLEIAREKARARGLDAPTLHHDRFESFDLGRAFQSIFCVNASFMLLPDDDATRAGLANIHRHLQPGGQALIALELVREPKARPGDDWRTVRRAEREDGATIDCRGKLLRYDPEAQIIESNMQYRELRGDGVVYEEQNPFLLHWHTQEQFAALLRETGFETPRFDRFNGEPADPQAESFVAVARRPS